MIRYQEYQFGFSERLRFLIQGMALLGLAAWLFYRSIPAVLLSFCLCPFYLKRKRKELLEKRKWELNLQFKDGIQCLSNCLGAGYSIENAFREAAGDLLSLYGSDSYIVMEFGWLDTQIRNNQTVEQGLADFAERSGVEDIQNFSEIFITAKRTGGDMMKIIRNTARNINSRIEIEREIKTMAAEKKLEASVMNAAPFGIIVYLSVASPGFLAPLYHNPAGIFIMTGALLAYAGAMALSERIMRIEL